MPVAMPRGQTKDICPNPKSVTRGVDRWELLSLVTELRQELGLTDRDVMVLRAHLTVLPHGPLDPAGLNISFMSVTNILERACGMEERRFRRGETRLEQSGLIQRRLSGNGRRFPERDRTGKIVSAYGIDVAPLIAAYPDLCALASLRHEQQLALRSRRNSASARLSAAIRTMITDGSALPDWINTLRDRLRKAVRQKAPKAGILDAIEADITRLEAEIKSHKQEESHLQSTLMQVNSAVDAGQSVRHIESEPKEKNKPSQSKFNAETLAYVWSQTNIIKDFFPQCPTQEREVATVLFDFSSYMKLGRQTMIRVLTKMGWEDTIATIDYIAENLPSIGHPQHYLRTLLISYERGESVAGGRVVPKGCYQLRRRCELSH